MVLRFERPVRGAGAMESPHRFITLPFLPSVLTPPQNSPATVVYVKNPYHSWYSLNEEIISRYCHNKYIRGAATEVRSQMKNPMGMRDLPMT